MFRRVAVLLLITCSILSSRPVFSQAADCAPDKTPRAALISAFWPELTNWLKEVNVQCVAVINGRSFTMGTLYGKPIVAFLSGVSMVNAALWTQLAVDQFKIERIYFSGIAGGVNPSLNVGDVVIPAQWSEYQENLFAREGADGKFMPGSSYKSTLPNFGMMHPQNVAVTRSGLDKPDATESMLWFQVDPAMLAEAKEAVSGITLADCATDKDNKKNCLQHMPMIKVGGNGVSGPTFVDNAAYREYAWKTWQADALDMESAAVTHVAYINHIPVLIFRSLSDLAGGGPGQNEIGTFFQLAADNSAKVFLTAFKKWAAK
jgi:adenosylhomocysteine nucleosidase